jgi:hypothetical protein
VIICAITKAQGLTTVKLATNQPGLPLSTHHSKSNTKKKDLRKELLHISLMNINVKILNKILANQSYNTLKKIRCHNQVVFIPGMHRWFEIGKFTYVIKSISKIKDKTYTIISIDV